MTYFLTECERLKIELTIDTLCNIPPDSVWEFMATEKHKVVKRAVTLVANQWHSLAD